MYEYDHTTKHNPTPCTTPHQVRACAACSWAAASFAEWIAHQLMPQSFGVREFGYNDGPDVMLYMVRPDGVPFTISVLDRNRGDAPTAYDVPLVAYLDDDNGDAETLAHGENADELVDSIAFALSAKGYRFPS